MSNQRALRAVTAVAASCPVAELERQIDEVFDAEAAGELSPIVAEDRREALLELTTHVAATSHDGAMFQWVTLSCLVGRMFDNQAKPDADWRKLMRLIDQLDESIDAGVLAA